MFAQIEREIERGFWGTLGQDFREFLDPGLLAVVTVRLLIAALLGGLLGYQRAAAGKAAGVRTHMLVALGAAFFVLIPQVDGMQLADASRIIQGIVTGIGFLGAGTILKEPHERRIIGLTTAAGIWLTSAVGVGVGLGRVGAAVVGAVLAFLILGVLQRLEIAAGVGNGDEPREP